MTLESENPQLSPSFDAERQQRTAAALADFLGSHKETRRRKRGRGVGAGLDKAKNCLKNILAIPPMGG